MNLVTFKGSKQELDQMLGIHTTVTQDDLDDIVQNDLEPMIRLCKLHDQLTKYKHPYQARNVLLALKSLHYQMGEKLSAYDQ